jgi:hypothetical protein
MTTLGTTEQRAVKTSSSNLDDYRAFLCSIFTFCWYCFHNCDSRCVLRYDTRISEWSVSSQQVTILQVSVNNIRHESQTDVERQIGSSVTLTNSTDQTHSWEATVPQAVKKFLAFYGTRTFITAFTSARHLSLYWARVIVHSPPLPTSRSILISSHIRPGLASGLFPSGLTTKTLHAPLLSPIRATHPAHLILLDLITRRFGK